MSAQLCADTLALVAAHGGNVVQAAKAARIPRGTLQSRLREAANAAPAKPFSIDPLPSPIDTDELLSRRKKQYAKKHAAADARKLIPVQIQIDGPIGIAHFGDPHVDDDGTNIHLLEQHVDIVNRTTGLFAANVGDYRNNWIGRLARLYGEQGTNAAEALVLAEWLIRKTDWLYLVGGNHDAWSGADDPIAWIAQQTNALHEPHAARLELLFPNGRKIRINARHDFKGHSMWNTAHGPAKAAQLGWRDHILTCGHLHTSGYQVLKDPSSGLITHAIRTASYKLHDRYAVEKGLPDQNIFVCPVTIIDPTKADDDPRLITTIFDPEEGAGYLSYKRKRRAA